MKRSFRTRGEYRPQYANKPAQRQTSSNHPYCEKTQSARGRENEAKQRKRANWEKDELEVSWGQEHWENRKEVNRNPLQDRVNLGQIWTLCMHGSYSPALAMMVQNLSFRKYLSQHYAKLSSQTQSDNAVSPSKYFLCNTCTVTLCVSALLWVTDVPFYLSDCKWITANWPQCHWVCKVTNAPSQNTHQHACLVSNTVHHILSNPG